MSEKLPISFDDVKDAARVLEGQIERTPLRLSRTLSAITGAEVWVKFENLQFTAAFKERGALNKLARLSDEEKSAGVIAASAGNHAQGVAYHGRRLGIPVTIVMPVATPFNKVQHTRDFGARVILEGNTFDEAKAFAETLRQREGLTWIHPFDDPLVAAGQGTVALEMLAEKDDFDCLVVPIGGGGLMSGMATVAKALKPEIEMVGVQAELFPSMYSAVTGDERPCGGDTLAEGIAVKAPGQFTRQIIAELVDEVLLVKEPKLEHSVSLLLQIEKTVVEGAGAAGLAAVLSNPEKFAGKTIGLVLCGGNIDTRLLANVLLRDLARSGRLARLQVVLQDRPGALFKGMREFNAHDVNIIEIYHQRIFTTLPAKGLTAEIECEARDGGQIDRLVENLRAKGYVVELAELA